ncbi:MAG: APC family permease [Mycobacterium sp.]|nr:APC family permease [Mycobacterium sp.]
MNADPDRTPVLRRALGLWSLVLFGLVYIGPLVVFTTYGIVTRTTGGRLTLAYLVTLVVMAFTALSYARMAAAFPVAGSAYAYTGKTFGARLGFLTGWSLLLDYLCLPMLGYLLIGLYLHDALPAIPAWVFIVAAVVIGTALNVVGIVSVTRANVLIVGVQVLFIVTFVVLALVHLAGTGGVSLTAPLRGDGTATGIGVVFAGAAVLCLSFLGFDAVSTLSEEATRPTRDVPRAIMIATVGCGLLFIVLAYVSQLVFPSNAFGDADSGSLDVMRAAGGSFLEVFFTAVFVPGALGAALTAQASVARVLYAMGRDGVLPRPFFGRLSLRFRTPARAVLLVGAVSLLAVVINLDTMASVVSFGALVAFSAVNLSVVKHYFLDEQDRSGMAAIRNLVLPLIGFALTVWLWTNLSGLTLAVGLGWLAVGVIWLLVLTRGFRQPTPMMQS